MAQMKITAAVLTLAIACTAATPALGQRNRSLESLNQPVVQRIDYVIDLSTSGDGVAQDELYRLDDWFEGLALGYGDRVSVESGGYGGERARQDIAGVAGEYGLLLSRGAPVTAGGVAPGAVRVIVSRSEATVPGCPNWSDAGEVGSSISTSPNYGCAINSNLAAMIADPNDLVLGQTHDGVSDPRETNKAITSYRNRPMTGNQGLKSERTGGSK